MNRNTVSILFPQWQGSSSKDAPLLMRGNSELANLLSHVIFEPIKVSRSAASTRMDNVNAKEDLLNHARNLRAVLNNQRPDRLFVLGGDCSVDVLPISYINHKYKGDLAVIWIDAHADLNTPESSPSKAAHGMALRTALGEGDKDLTKLAYRSLKPEQVWMIGVRNYDPEELWYTSHYKVKQFTAKDINHRSHALAEKLHLHEVKQIYIHLDIDALDPSDLNACNFPSSEGIRAFACKDLLTSLYKQFDVLGFSLCEYAPKLSPNQENKERMSILASFFADNPLL